VCVALQYRTGSPEITGWTQINGQSEMAWQDAFRMDVWYADHSNVMLDFRIIKATFAKFFKEGFPVFLTAKNVSRALVRNLFRV